MHSRMTFAAAHGMTCSEFYTDTSRSTLARVSLLICFPLAVIQRPPPFPQLAHLQFSQSSVHFIVVDVASNEICAISSARTRADTCDILDALNTNVTLHQKHAKNMFLWRAPIPLPRWPLARLLPSPHRHLRRAFNANIGIFNQTSCWFMPSQPPPTNAIRHPIIHRFDHFEALILIVFNFPIDSH